MRTIMTIIFSFFAYHSIQLGIDYNTIGHGLHPVLSTIIAVFALGVPLLWTYTDWLQGEEDEFEHITLEQAHCSVCGQHRDLINGRCLDFNACMNSH